MITQPTPTELKEQLANAQAEIESQTKNQEILREQIKQAERAEQEALQQRRQAATVASRSKFENRLRELLPELNAASAHLQKLTDEVRALAMQSGINFPMRLSG